MFPQGHHTEGVTIVLQEFQSPSWIETKFGYFFPVVLQVWKILDWISQGFLTHRKFLRPGNVFQTMHPCKEPVRGYRMTQWMKSMRKNGDRIMWEIPEPWDFTEESWMNEMDLTQERYYVGYRQWSSRVKAASAFLGPDDSFKSSQWRRTWSLRFCCSPYWVSILLWYYSSPFFLSFHIDSILLSIENIKLYFFLMTGVHHWEAT